MKALDLVQINILYLDQRTGELVLKRDIFQPPETYFIIFKGYGDNIYTDHFRRGNQGLDFSYTSQEMWENDPNYNNHVYYYLKANNFVDSIFTGRTYPPKHFNRILSMFLEQKREEATELDDLGIV